MLAQVEWNTGRGAAAGSRADAALYWKAYSQSRLTENEEALKTIQDLAKQFATSPWVKDARALAVERRHACVLGHLVLPRVVVGGSL